MIEVWARAAVPQAVPPWKTAIRETPLGNPDTVASMVTRAEPPGVNLEGACRVADVTDWAAVSSARLTRTSKTQNQPLESMVYVIWVKEFYYE